MSVTVKAAWIGAVGVVLAAFIAGYFSTQTAPSAVLGDSHSTQGDCGAIITGESVSNVKVSCEKAKP